MLRNVGRKTTGRCPLQDILIRMDKMILRKSTELAMCMQGQPVAEMKAEECEL